MPAPPSAGSASRGCSSPCTPSSWSTRRGIATRRADAVAGVRAVMTARDVPHNVLFSDVPGQTTAVGPLRARTQVLADPVVRYLGEAIALVAAETEEAAEEAARLVHVEYQDVPGVFDPEAAMRPDAPQLEPS